ncbi:unnamed protein product [Paramecium sonneborni]|uniref:WD40-repeat-containing domain n=1 Tax=Paramecium sonneborni TaxID=65129 RepID=A0A8S1PKU8_9CILI|nr:unnamed protein product [Paramecium sonneborni]
MQKLISAIKNLNNQIQKEKYLISYKEINQTYGYLEDDKNLTDFQLSEDDLYIVSAYKDSHIKVWDMKTYKVLFKQKMDTKGLLVSFYESTLKIWNFKALRQQQNFEMDGHIDSLEKILASADGLVLCSQSDREIKFWDLEELTLLNEYNDSYIWYGNFDNTGTYFAFESEIGMILFKIMGKVIIEKFILKREQASKYFYFTSDSQQIVQNFFRSQYFLDFKEAEKLKWNKLFSHFQKQSFIKFTIADKCKYVIAHRKFKIFEVDSNMKLKQIHFKGSFNHKVLNFCLSNCLNMIEIQFDQQERQIDQEEIQQDSEEILSKEIFIFSLSQMEVLKKIECNYQIRLFCFSLNDEFLILLCRQEYLVFQIVYNQINKIKRVELTSEYDQIFPFQENQFIFFQKQDIQLFQNLELFNNLEIEHNLTAFCTKDKFIAVPSEPQEAINIYKLKGLTEIEKLATVYPVQVIKNLHHCNSTIQFSQNCQFLNHLGKTKSQDYGIQQIQNQFSSYF